MAEENVQKLLDMLYEMIDEAKNAPLSNDKCVLNRDEALDLLDEIRAQMPVELKRAQELVRARDEYVEAAKRDVERMMQKAEFEAKSKVSESEVLTAARAKGHEIVTRAGRDITGVLANVGPFMRLVDHDLEDMWPADENDRSRDQDEVNGLFDQILTVASECA